MQVTRPNEFRRPGVRLHPKACAALGLEAERATPKRLGTPVPRTAARSRGRAAGGGTAPDTRRPLTTVAGQPPGDGPPPPPRHAAPTGHAGQGDRDGPPRPHSGARSTWVADPNSPPSGRAVGGGGAPDLRRPSQRWKAAPPGDALPPPPQRATPARKGACCGTGAGSPRLHQPHPEHTGRGTPAARPRGRAVGGGTAPDTRRPSQQWQATPPGTAPHHTTPVARSPHKACRPRGQCWAPTTTHPRPQHVGSGPQQPAQWAGSQGRGSASPQTPLATTAPSQVGVNRDRTAPLQARRTEPGQPQKALFSAKKKKHARLSKGPGQDTRRGMDNVKRPYQRPAPGPREVRTPHHPEGGGADSAGARAHTHAKGERGLPEGQPDRARGTHRLRGMAYQRARVRDIRRGRPATRSAGHAGREGGNGSDTTPGTGPSPPNRPRAPRTHGRGPAPAKAVVAHCATPQPLG